VPHIARRKPPPAPEWFLREDEWKALRAELPDHLRQMAEFALTTGLRWSNVAGLTWDRVSLQRRIVWVEAATAKGRKPIQIPLSRAAVAILRRVPGERTGHVFLYAGRPISSAKTAWRKATERAGLAGFTFHGLRRTWASWHAMGGTPQDVLQSLGAWQSPEMVKRYAHLAPSYVAQFADNAKPVRAERRASKAA
jgi:integrase